MRIVPAPTPFLASKNKTGPGGVALLGVPYDGTASFRSGASKGPSAIREASEVLETYSPDLDGDLEEGLPLADLGDMEIEEGPPGLVAGLVSRAVFDLAERGICPLILGGEHSITPGAVASVAAIHQGLLVIQLDAHADLREEYEGEGHSHACAMRRCLDHVPEHSLLQVGIRSGTRAEWEELRSSGRYVKPTADALRAAIESRSPERIYLSVDLDVFDPSVLPGTGTPEPGGIDWPTFAELLGAMPLDLLVGADVVELAPEHDPTGRSAIVAAKVVRELVIARTRRS
jgi:agmatinase